MKPRYHQIHNLVCHKNHCFTIIIDIFVDTSTSDTSNSASQPPSAQGITRTLKGQA